MTARAAAIALTLSTLVASGCTSSVTFDDDDGGDPGPCEAAPTCDPGDLEVPECSPGGDCYEVSICGSTIYCEPDAAQCNAYPACNPGDEEVAICPDDGSCYEAEACGSVILCHELAQCDGYPSCDPGDTDVTDQGCPLDASCYEATLCGSTILCLDEGQKHGCPEDQPVEGELCDYELSYGISCDYLDGNGCFSTFACQVTGEDKPPEWVFVGGGCDGGGT